MKKKTLNIYFYSPEFLNDNKTDLVDGGIAHEYYKWGKELINQGHKVTIAVNSKSKKMRKYIFEDITVYECNFKSYSKTLRFLLFLLSFGKIHYRHGIQLFFHSQNLKEKIDIIQYCSDCLLQNVLPINLPHCVRIACDIWSAAKYNMKTLRSKVLHRYEKQLSNTKFIFGPSEHIADNIKQKLQINQDVDIIESPIILREIEEDNKYYNKLREKKYILYFGTISVLKGCVQIADIAYNLLNEYEDYYLVFVGKSFEYNGDTLIKHIKNCAKEHKNRVIHFDKMPHKYLYPIIKGAEFCIMPSLTENFSNTCIEAMSLRKIVIGSTPFFNQIIKEGNTGFLCEAENSQSLHSAIKKVLALSDNDKKQIEHNAYKRAITCNVQDKVKELLKYYNKVIKNFKYKN